MSHLENPRTNLPPALTDPAALTGTQRSRRLLSVFFVVWMAAIALWNFPDYSLRHPWQGVSYRAYDAVYLSMEWDYFAPDARANSGLVWGEIHYTDGTVDRFDPPDDSGLIGSYRKNRWAGAMNRVVSRDESAQALADWLPTQADPSRTVDRAEVWAELYWTPNSTHGPVERRLETRRIHPPEEADR